MPNLADSLMQDFALKQYVEVDLSDLGGRYVGEKLPVWVNPPNYYDQIRHVTVGTLDFTRWVVETMYENPNGAKVFTHEQVVSMPDAILGYLGRKASDEYEKYQKKIPVSLNN